MARRNNTGMILRVVFSLIMIYLLPGAISPCSEPLVNIALYEGTLNTLIYYPATPNSTQWSTVATTDELTEVTLVNYTDTIDPDYAADYSFSPQGLTIKAATTTADYSTHQLSTAGWYVVQCSGGNPISFKVLVVTSGPTCSISSDKTSVSCSSIYADSTYEPIAAVFTLYVDGNLITTYRPQRTNNDANTWISASTFPITYNAGSTYQCLQTFGQPTEVQDPSLVTNAPRFNQSCSIPPTETVATTKPSTTTTSTVATIRSSATASTSAKATTKSTAAAGSSTTTSTTITTKTTTTLKGGAPVSYGTGTILTIPPTAQSSATENAANDTTTPLITSGLSEGGKIGIGVGIGVGGILALGGILLAVLCRRSQRIKKIKTDDDKTKGIEDDCERGRSHEDNSIVQNYEPLKLPSSQEAYYDQLTTSTKIVNSKDQVSPIYENCDHTMGACVPTEQPPSDEYDSIIEQT